MRCTVYGSIIAPLFDYCSSILVGISGANLNHLQKLQNQGMRIILTIRCNKYVRIIDMLNALQFMSVKERIEFNECVLVYKMINGLFPDYLANKIQLVRSDNAMQTRQMSNLMLDRCKTREEQKILLYDGFKMFNNLPIELKKKYKVQSFRSQLVQYIKRKKRENKKLKFYYVIIYILYAVFIKISVYRKLFNVNFNTY